VVVLLQDNTKKAKRRKEYQLEMEGFRFFQGATQYKQQMGSLMMANCDNLNLIDDDRATLLRKTPTKLKVCFFVTIQSIDHMNSAG
jgi:hypothetical protein